MHGLGHNSRVLWDAHHAEGLSRARLSVREQATVVPLKGVGQHDGAQVPLDALLGGGAGVRAGVEGPQAVVVGKDAGVAAGRVRQRGLPVPHRDDALGVQVLLPAEVGGK